MTLILVRHGETDALGRVLSGRSATPMNAAGAQIALAPAGVTVLRKTDAAWTLAALNLPGGAP